MAAQWGLSRFSKQNSPDVPTRSGETLLKRVFVTINPLDSREGPGHPKGGF